MNNYKSKDLEMVMKHDRKQNFHSCPASSGFIEDIFSTFGLVWANILNRLEVQKKQKR